MNSFSAERAVSPLDGSELWVVLDPELVPHREASDFLRALHGASRSPHTVRVYAGRVASFLGWCASQGVEWSSVSLASLARFKHFVEATPGRGGRLRSGTTVNATLTAVCEFLRFCARTGVIEQAVAGQLSEPRWLRFTPPGFDAGEFGQFRMVRARMLKARAETAFPEAFTPEQAGRVMACCRRPRERFMVTLLLDGGLRIGEALGLRRSDLHLLPDSRCVGCAVLGAHVHVRHRANPNGALAKSRFPRTVPASDAVLSSYADYQHERAEILGQVFANPAILNNTVYTVLVHNCHLRHEVDFDHGEDIATHIVPISELPALVASGRIGHSLVVAALYHFERWLTSPLGQSKRESGQLAPKSKA